MSTYPKRTESSLVTSILNYLQVLENLGSIAFYNRQQAGSMSYTKKSGKESMMRLGRKGVADIYCIPKFKTACACGYSNMVWIEAKLDKGVQSKNQKEFQGLVESCGHHYFIIRNCDELQNRLKSIGVL